MKTQRGVWPQRAFTLVELLVVIVIIGILVALLVPAVAKVRQVGKETACKAVIQSIGTGLETYKGSEKLGGTYPPSFSDVTAAIGGLQVGQVRSPYTNQPIPMTGAGLLVWALSGADQLGTPGFQTLGSLATWAQGTGNAINGGVGNAANPAGAYTIYTTGSQTGQPAYTRYGPYMEGSKVKITRNVNAAGLAPDFVVPGEPEARAAMGIGLQSREYPMYLDGFGYPVLYWRADLAGRDLADSGRLTPTAIGRGVYHWEDNAGLVDLGATDVRLLTLNKSGGSHALGWNGGNYGTTSPPPLGCFQAYVRDQGAQAKLWPQRADSYLLVSPGYDGLYGTADDITNFQHNGQ